MKDLVFFSKIIAAISFATGTTLLLLFVYFNKSDAIAIFGLYFVTIAFIINTLLLIVNIIALIIDSEYRMELIKTCGIMLLNIPIAILYFYIFISITFPEGL